jgi:SAM-dependent methyltransferase
MAIVAVVPRQCPQCGGEAFHSLPDYSAAPWQVVQCPACSFVYLRNPPQYERLSSEFAWEKTRVAEVARRKTNSPVRMWLDRMTRWHADIYSPGIAGRLKRLFAPGRVLDFGCGSGKKVPEPFIPVGVEISEGLCRGALEHEAQPKALLAQCSRVLADDGAIYVRVPNYGSLNWRLLGAKWCGFRYPDHVNYFTTQSLKSMAGDCGLKLTLLNPLRVPLDDNINAVLKRGQTMPRATA